MPISFQCGQCDKNYVVSDGLAGKKAMCKQCGNRMTIPGDATPSSTPAAVEARPAAPRPAPPRSVTGASASVPVSRPKPVPTNPEPAFDDIYGLNEAPSALPQVMPRIGGGGDSGSDDDGPVKKKKKKKGFFASSGSKKASSSSGGGMNGGQILGIAVFIMLGVFAGIRGFGLSSKSEVMRFNERQLAAVKFLTASLRMVNSVPSAVSMSTVCNKTVQDMITNLETNRHKKAKIEDVNAAKQEIMPRMMAAKSELESEFRRVAMIPGAIPALNIMPAIDRLAALESELSAQNAQLGVQ